MPLHQKLPFRSWACVCTLWLIGCGGGSSPAQSEAGKGGSHATRDAGPDAAHSDAGGGDHDASREDAGGADAEPGTDGAAPGGNGGAGGGAAQGGGGQGGGASGAGGSGEPATSALYIDSFAPTGAEVGGVFRYRVLLDQAGPASFELTSAPEGATIDDNGLVVWTPSFNQGGEAHSFSVKASLAGVEATQDFEVAVTALTITAEELLDPDSEELQIISVSSPLSGASGVSLTVPPGALSAPSTISISTTSGAPSLPSQSSSGELPIVLGFGPSGSVFNSPVNLVIPLSSAALQRLLAGQTASAWTLGSDGLWQSLPISYVDLENGYVQVQLQHFSLVGLMAAPGLLTLDQAQLGAATCPDAVFVKAGFTESAGSEPGAERWLNGADISGFAADSTLKGLLAMVPAGHSIQLRLRALLSAAAGDKKLRQSQVFSFEKRADGQIDVLVTSEGGNVLYRETGLTADSAEIDQLLGGAHTHFVFHDFPATQDGEITLEAFAYLRWPDAPPILAGSEGQAFASLVQPLVRSALSTGDNDTDCDGIANDADETMTLALPPRMEASSETTLRTTVNTALTLAVNVVSEASGGVVVTWSSTSPAAMITSQPDGLQASFVSSMPGSYKVTAVAQDAAGTTSQSFLVIVDSPVAPNTPPRCKINAKQTGLFTGGQIPLEAVLEDAEQPNQELSVEWRVSAGAALSSSSERRISFGAEAPAVYEVTCVARDGVSTGQPTTLSITVFDRPQNTPPRLSFVAPASATLQIPGSGLASQLIRVSATDIDNDQISIQFTLLEGDANLALAASPDNTPGTAYAARTFETAVPGPYAVLVRAVDQNNATSESVVVKLLVAQSLSGTDADGDGFPASVDCDDGNVGVFPGAREICGDSIDQNCNGSDRALADCDADRDGTTTHDGDCDDNNPNVFPGARERCNGRDDNCNATIDEGYVVGAECSIGTGGCRATGLMVCSRDGAASVCNAKPAATQPETCNGIDDDCNGTVDDVPTQGTADINNCGGCGTVCSGGASQVPACVLNQEGKLGCAYTCSAGFIDLDRNAQNGCEYSCATPGKETCNSADDDCDGRVDEQADEAFYPGAEGTLGRGECRSGLRICKEGVLVEAIAPVTPVAERCDMRDNNCDGTVDEGFDLGGSCDGPDSDLCAYGRLVCGSNGLVMCGLERDQNVRDVCDGQDNDCNAQTPDGHADLQLNNACDEQNKEFCEPGRSLCTDGRLICSNEGRDAVTCKVCACDSSESCDTNGEGYVCPCDPQCFGPDVGCPCDAADGCDLVDGAEECGCDQACVGETACGCDQQDGQCDVADGGFVCACDSDCKATCGCDAAAGVCDKTPDGDACLCDSDCYPSCSCDDRDPNVCPTDSSGNVCGCDPTCKAGSESCTCDVTQQMCDVDTQMQPCQCDADCRNEQCNCNSTPGCDTAAAGDACLCDVDCAPECPCDDHDPNVCARDGNGNACQCDPSCFGGEGPRCECDAAAGVCDNDPMGNPCGCDADCAGPCDCDASSGVCDLDAAGKQCVCDRDCGTTPVCDCDVTTMACDRDQQGNPCMCDPACAAGPCDCDVTAMVCDTGPTGAPCMCDPACAAGPCDCDVTAASCDMGPTGAPCMCDPACAAGPCECDVTAMVCDMDPTGAPCMCDPACAAGPCDCDVTAASCDMGPTGAPCMCDPACAAGPCDCDVTAASCDMGPTGAPCMCDPACAAGPCDCDVTAMGCDMDPTGAPCMCDPACAAGPCDCDVTAMGCDMDPTGAPCMCDPACAAGACDCDVTAMACDMGPTGAPCSCDKDCSASACACDVSAEVCDQNQAGDDCLCDQRCYAPCPCADDDPMLCRKDSDGHACKCDPGCEQEPASGCACDLQKGVCELNPENAEPCACDIDCGAPPPPCACDTSAEACNLASSGDACLCDRECYPACACDDLDPATCARDSAGNACRCDPSCQGGPTPTCPCDANPSMCDTDAAGQACACDIDCQSSACECDQSQGACDKDPAGQDCSCDLDCRPSPCECDQNQGMCDTDQAGQDCACDSDCSASQCTCNQSQGVCDVVNGQACACDLDCPVNPCSCDQLMGTCDSVGGVACECDLDCP